MSAPAGSMRLLLGLSRRIDALLGRIADWTGWLMLVLMAVIVVDVISRKAGYQFPYLTSTRLQELEWHLHTVIFSGWIAYCYVINAHPRVDSVTAHLDLRRKAWIELVGCVVFAFPYAYVCIHYAVPFLVTSYAMGEMSDAPNGLPHRWAIKAVYVGGLLLIPFAILSMFIKCVVALFGGPAADEAKPPLDAVALDV